MGHKRTVTLNFPYLCRKGIITKRIFVGSDDKIMECDASSLSQCHLYYMFVYIRMKDSSYPVVFYTFMIPILSTIFFIIELLIPYFQHAPGYISHSGHVLGESGKKTMKGNERLKAHKSHKSLQTRFACCNLQAT